MEEITDFLTNRLGKMIQDQIKQTIGTVHQTQPERTERNHTQKDPPYQQKNPQRDLENAQDHQEEEQQNEAFRAEDPPWITVRGRGWHGRRNQSNNTIKGTKKDEEMQAAEKIAWLYVGGLKKMTTTDTVVNYLKKERNNKANNM